MNGIYAISTYNFDHVARRQSAAARKAANLLADFNETEAALAYFYSQVLGALEQLAAIMLRVLDSSFRSSRDEFRSLRKRVQAARQAIPAVPVANLLATACDQLDQWLDNLERLVSSSRKDSGG